MTDLAALRRQAEACGDPMALDAAGWVRRDFQHGVVLVHEARQSAIIVRCGGGWPLTVVP